MNFTKYFNELFTVDHLVLRYNEKLKDNASVGLDKITPDIFEKKLKDNARLICNKVKEDNYKFTRYRQILISKGEGKAPRTIAVPTVRDKLTLNVLNEYLVGIYGQLAVTKLPHTILNAIICECSTGEYDSFIKLDIESFYGKIDHSILNRKLNKKIRIKTAISLIMRAIKTESLNIPVKQRKEISNRELGIPEGLSISNALANIYMIDIDKKYGSKDEIMYTRYVDDILIFCKNENCDFILQSIKKDLRKIKLTVNGKEAHGQLGNSYDYLGYSILWPLITVREKSVLKLEQSLEKIFNDYKYAKNKNIEFLKWKINIKVSGFVLNKEKYGWMFFYSQINDMKLLGHLDWLITKLSYRFNIEENVIFKRFKRTYYEITKNLHETTYIPNFDLYDIDTMKNVLNKIYNQDVSELSNEKIIIEFKKIMKREVKEVEKDIQSIS